MIPLLVICIYVGGFLMMIPLAARFMVRMGSWPSSLHQHREAGLEPGDIPFLLFLCVIWPGSAIFITGYYVGLRVRNIFMRAINFNSLMSAINRSAGVK